LVKKKLIVKGEKVQDVGYRLFLLEAAESMGLKGFYARNVGDYVEFLVEGEDGKMAEFLSFAKTHYPELARVSEVIVEDYEGNVMPVEGFYRSFSLNQLVKIVNIGANMLEKQGSMLEKQDAMLEKQDKMLEKQDLMLEKQDTMLEKMDKMLEKQNAMLEKQDTMLEKMDNMLEKQDKMLEKQDKMLEKQDSMLVKMDQMLEKQDKMLEKQDLMLEKQDVLISDVKDLKKGQDILINEVRSLREDLKAYMDERFRRLEAEIVKIKKKIGID